MTCVRCNSPATVMWPVRDRPHCAPCVADARAFLARTARKYPVLGIVRFEPEATHVALAVVV